MEKHYEKQQTEKEHAALASLDALIPQLGKAVKVLALQECSWDVQQTVALLRQFQAANLVKLNQLRKVRRFSHPDIVLS